MAKKQGYEERIIELEKIIADIEGEQIPIDELSAKVKRAAELIKECQAVLENTEKDVEGILKSLDDKS